MNKLSEVEQRKLVGLFLDLRAEYESYKKSQHHMESMLQYIMHE